MTSTSNKKMEVIHRGQPASFEVKFNGFSVMGDSMEGPPMTLDHQSPYGDSSDGGWRSTWVLMVGFSSNSRQHPKAPAMLFVRLVCISKGPPPSAGVPLGVLSVSVLDSSGHPAWTTKSNGALSEFTSSSTKIRENVESQCCAADCLTVVVNITPTLIAPFVVAEPAVLPPPPKWQPKAAAVTNSSQLLDPTYADMTLLVEGERLPAHKCILCPRSEVFRAMFQVSMKEAATNEVELDGAGWHAATVKEALRFLYTGTLQEAALQAMAAELLAFSSTYQMQELKAYVEGYCMATISEDNVTGIIVAAEQHGCEELRKHAMQFVASNSKRLITKPGFLDGLSDARCREIVELQAR